MNYYNEIKEQLLSNEVYKRVKDYSKNRSDLNTYYNVGKLLKEAGKNYGERIIEEYSKKLTNELGKGYTVTNLKYMRQFYNFAKSHSLSDQLSWTHYRIMLPLKNNREILYYIKISVEQNLSVRKLKEKIKNNEYERLTNETKKKIILNEENKINDFIKNPIIIKNKHDYEKITEKILKKIILEDISDFMKELGDGFCFIKDEYKIKLGDRYNYIDLILFNYKYNCFVVVELKVTELKKEHIGQIKLYMNYIDNNIRNIEQEKTIGIIICKKGNEFVMEYCSDDRIFETDFVLS